MCDFGKTVIYFFLLQVRELYVIYSLTQAVKNGVQSKEASDNQLCSREVSVCCIVYIFLISIHCRK